MKRKQLERLLRWYLGAQQFVYHPYTSIPIVSLIVLFIVGWVNKERFILIQGLPILFRSIVRYSISIVFVLSFVVFLLGWIEWLGTITARHDESRLEKAFTDEDKRNGCPILIYRRKLKGTDVTVRVFYSDIPLKVWLQRQEEILDQFSEHFVRLPDYGGRNNDNSKLILMHMAPGRKAKDRGILYDEEL